ncbi:Lipase, class 3 [Corchorus olitorius]|uniref:Lipase, class 3 n=1 Tax=Corchorus olitorius TaxID=93759 RepID=A0A1R3K4U7_9ROSI|nr:Lipase, class 3 [Corchorus olitorius]
MAASAECNKDFCSNYLILDPTKATLLDIFRLLFSSDLNNRKFVDSSEEKQEDFRHRLIIFVSILIQYLLQLFSKPLAWMGSSIETMINLLPSNGGFYGLITNIIRGNNVIPDRDSETFISYIGSLDTRMELDRNIKNGHGMYYPSLAIMAAKAAYNNKAYTQIIVEEHWEMKHLGLYEYWNDYMEKTTTQALLFQEKVTSDDQDTTIVVAFRGTETYNSDDWCSDFDFSWYELPNVGKIHSGFMKALGLQKSVGWPKEPVPNPSRKEPLAYYHIRDILRNILSNNKRAKFIVTGHSLGGALAALFPAVLFFHDEELLLERLTGVYTFGQPRVGDEMFGNYMENNLKRHGIQYYRFVYSNDMVPRVPFDDKNFVFKHFGSCVYYNSRYEGEIVKEEPFKNYFSIRAVFPMMTNAMYELLRSFTIVKERGSGYREGFVLIFLRIIGLVVPGVPAHSTMDYVNSTRLGPDALFPH